MNVYWNETIIAVTTVVAITAVSVAYLGNASRYHRKRVSELNVVKAALKEHFIAVEKLTDDPALSDDLKILLLTFSEAVENREVARFFANELASGRLFNGKKKGGKNPVFDELQRLKKVRPDLPVEMLKAVKSGLIALILRWPETAKVFNQLVAETLDDSKEAAAFAKISQFALRLFGGDSHFDNNLPKGGAAATA